jgi:hypothetical protein
MSYEVLYKYHQRNDAGYNKEEVKELKEKVGEPFEETTLEKLASVIIAQLARRDIWVFDVEISEYKKQKISFRETKGGIVIKNRKFILNGANIVSQEIEEAKPVSNAMVPVPQNINLAQPLNSGRPVKWVILDPDERNVGLVKAAGLAFTPDKRYPVFSEIPHPSKFGIMVYTMQDDRNREVSVHDEYFLPADQILQRGFSVSIDKGSGGNPKLSFGNKMEEPAMPDIRGRR